MEEMHSCDNKVESEHSDPSGTRAIVVSLTEEVELDRVDYVTLLVEIRI